MTRRLARVIRALLAVGIAGASRSGPGAGLCLQEVESPAV